MRMPPRPWRRPSREVARNDDDTSGDSEKQSQPKIATRALAEDQPTEQSYEDGSIVAEQSGVSGERLQDRSVEKCEIESEEKPSDSDGDQCSGIHARRFAAEEPRGNK